MNTKYEKGNIIFDFSEILDRMDAESKRNLVQHLACDDDIVRHVCDQVCDGWTEDGWHGTTSGPCVEPWTPLDIMARKIAEKSSEIAAREIKRLCEQLQFEKDQGDKLRNENFRLKYPERMRDPL